MNFICLQAIKKAGIDHAINRSALYNTWKHVVFLVYIDFTHNENYENSPICPVNQWHEYDPHDTLQFWMYAVFSTHLLSLETPQTRPSAKSLMLARWNWPEFFHNCPRFLILSTCIPCWRWEKKTTTFSHLKEPMCGDTAISWLLEGTWNWVSDGSAPGCSTTSGWPGGLGRSWKWTCYCKEFAHFAIRVDIFV